MNFTINENLGIWLNQLNGVTVDKVYKIDSTRNIDDREPNIILIIFKTFDKFLLIEGLFDAQYIDVNFKNNKELDETIRSWDNPESDETWQVSPAKSDETLGEIVNLHIKNIEYGIDKNELQVNGDNIKGKKEYFNFLQFHSNNKSISIFAGATGLLVSNDKNIVHCFGNNFDRFTT